MTQNPHLAKPSLTIKELNALHAANLIKVGEQRKYLQQRIVLNGATKASSKNAATELVRIAVKPYGPRVKF